jgi:hypothetical protein
MPEEQTSVQDPAAGSAPWSADLESRFPDPEQRAAVDAYLRETQQPRMTQLEQRVAQAGEAQALYDAFREDPTGTYLSVTEQLYGEDARDRLISALNGEQGDAAQQQAQEQVAAAAQTAETAPPASAISDEDRRLLDEIAKDRNMRMYAEAIGKFIDETGMDQAHATHANQHVHDFVAAAEGDIPEGFRRYQAAFSGVALPTVVDPGAGDGNAGPPPVLDGTAGSAVVPPVQRKVSFDDAFKEFEVDLKNANHPQAPPVGVA